jgi:hypothetical protein
MITPAAAFELAGDAMRREHCERVSASITCPARTRRSDDRPRRHVCRHHPNHRRRSRRGTPVCQSCGGDRLARGL